jgi:hypothetical protein
MERISGYLGAGFSLIFWVFMYVPGGKKVVGLGVVAKKYRYLPLPCCGQHSTAGSLPHAPSTPAFLTHTPLGAGRTGGNDRGCRLWVCVCVCVWLG